MGDQGPQHSASVRCVCGTAFGTTTDTLEAAVRSAHDMLAAHQPTCPGEGTRVLETVVALVDDAGSDLGQRLAGVLYVATDGVRGGLTTEQLTVIKAAARGG